MGNKYEQANWLGNQTDGESMHPSQFQDFYGSSSSLKPEQLLIQSVLDQAFVDLRKMGERKRFNLHGPIQSQDRWNTHGRNTLEAQFTDLKAWFEDPGDWPFSFQWICHKLPGVDPDAILSMLRRCDWYPQRYESIEKSKRRAVIRHKVNGRKNDSSANRRHYLAAVARKRTQAGDRDAVCLPPGSGVLSTLQYPDLESPETPQQTLPPASVGRPSQVAEEGNET